MGPGTATIDVIDDNDRVRHSVEIRVASPDRVEIQPVQDLVLDEGERSDQIHALLVNSPVDFEVWPFSDDELLTGSAAPTATGTALVSEAGTYNTRETHDVLQLTATEAGEHTLTVDYNDGTFTFPIRGDEAVGDLALDCQIDNELAAQSGLAGCFRRRDRRRRRDACTACSPSGLSPVQARVMSATSLSSVPKATTQSIAVEVAFGALEATPPSQALQTRSLCVTPTRSRPAATPRPALFGSPHPACSCWAYDADAPCEPIGIPAVCKASEVSRWSDCCCWLPYCRAAAGLRRPPPRSWKPRRPRSRSHSSTRSTQICPASMSPWSPSSPACRPSPTSSSHLAEAMSLSRSPRRAKRLSWTSRRAHSAPGSRSMYALTASRAF